MTDTEKLALGSLAGTALNSTYTCSVPGCTHPTHVVKDGCPFESAAVVEARKIGFVQYSLLNHLKTLNPLMVIE